MLIVARTIVELSATFWRCTRLLTWDVFYCFNLLIFLGGCLQVESGVMTAISKVRQLRHHVVTFSRYTSAQQRPPRAVWVDGTPPPALPMLVGC